jgi:hypothetical protein
MKRVVSETILVVNAFRDVRDVALTALSQSEKVAVPTSLISIHVARIDVLGGAGRLSTRRNSFNPSPQMLAAIEVGCDWSERSSAEKTPPIAFDS